MRWVWSVLLSTTLSARVILVSFDGLGHQILETDPAARNLTAIRATAQRGAKADGVQPAFPSTTANSHAAIWTGAYGNVSNITFNSQPFPDRPRHGFSERMDGFRSTALAAEPFWVTAARQGKRAVAHQATQAYPFTEVNTAPGAVVVNGYQTATIPPQLILLREDPREWEAGRFRFRAERRGNRIHVRQLPAGPAIELNVRAAESQPPARRALAGYFHRPLLLQSEPPLALYFRAFPRPGGVALLATAIQELALHDGTQRNDRIVRELLAEEGPFLPNGATALLNRDLLSPLEYLETVELQIRQALRHAQWLDRRFRPHVLQSYLPFPDETDHRWIALDRLGDANARRWRQWVFTAVNRAAIEYGKLARRGDSIVFVSDHGMTPVERGVNLTVFLEQAGLAGAAAPLPHAFLVNAPPWKDGSQQRAEVRSRLRAALGMLREPDTGDPLVTGIFTPEADGERYGIGGSAGADLYYDLKAGWAAFESDKSVLYADSRPVGTHGFLPSRDDMLAICVAAGPRIAPGTIWPRMRSIQIAPLVSDLLGIGPPKDARGISPLRTLSPSPAPGHRSASGSGATASKLRPRSNK